MNELLEVLSRIEDPRQEWKVKHSLKDVIIIVLVAMLGNADDWVEMEMFARLHEKTLRKYLELPNGIPSHDTMQRVFSILNPEQIQQIKTAWEELLESNEGEKLKKILCMDGKTMRGNGNKNQKALHIVSAWSKEGGICFGQRAVCEKSNEITAMDELLDTLSPKGQIITIDAMGTQTAIAEKIRKKKAEYVLAVKKNQKTLYEQLFLYFEDVEFLNVLKSQGCYHCTKEKAHGQIEKREYYQTDAIAWMHDKEKWSGLCSIGMSVSTICKEGKEPTTEKRYYISSLPVDLPLFREAVRGHWSVESMHWHLDVTFREDHNATLDKNAAMNLNILRKFCIGILKLLDVGKKVSLKKKRFAVSCKPERFLEEIFGL